MIIEMGHFHPSGQIAGRACWSIADAMIFGAPTIQQIAA